MKLVYQSYENRKACKFALYGLVIVGLLGSGEARAVITLHDGSIFSTNVTGAGVQTINNSFTVTPGASVLVTALWDNNGNDTTNGSPSFLIWSNATLGTTQTLTRAVSANEQAYTYSDCDLYYLWNPSAGTGYVSGTDRFTGSTPTMMFMQTYTLAGVDTNATPFAAGNGNASATTLSVSTPSGTANGSWAAMVSVNYNGGAGNNITNTASSGWAVSFNFRPAPGGNVLQMAMGYITNLSAGVSTLSASASGVATHMAMAAMVLPPVAGTATPTNVTATGQLHQVVLSWSDASGGAATNYTIYRSTASSSGYSAIATNNGNANTNYTDAAVTDWTTYYYEVTASGPGGVSLFSFPPASATPFGSQTSLPQIALHDGSTGFVANGGINSLSANFTVTAGASVLVVSLFDRNDVSTTNSPASLTWTAPGYGAQTITRAVAVNNAASAYADSDIYYLFNPNPGSATITATDTSGSTPSAMTMQAYTLSGVDTNVPPITYAANNASTLSLALNLSSSTPLHAWAVVNSSYGTGGISLNVASSSGAVNCPMIWNTTEQSMGYVANLDARTSTISLGVGPGGSVQKMALAVAVFKELVTGPRAPTNLVANAQANQVALSWNDASGGAATNYILFRSTTSSTGYTAIVTNTSNAATSYTDTTVTPWTTYYYVVRAVASSGVSEYSAQASAAPLGLPATPTGLWAIPGNEQVVLYWNAQAGATNFNVLRSTTSGSGFAPIARVNANTYTDTPLVNGTTYYYEVNASNSFGTSGNTAQLTATPTSVPNAHIAVNCSNVVRIADTRWLGINAAVTCPDFNVQHGVPTARKAGWTTLRFPGGSFADQYHWQQNNISTYTTYATFASVATNLGATVFITANYGSGSAAEAAGWVADANVTNHYGFKYWEVGNECYGQETDTNARPHDPYTYATKAAAYIQQMKAIDPTIKVGVVAVTGQTTDSNGYSDHPATNLVNGTVVYGWTPVVLSTLRQAGMTPDFLIYHAYPQSGGNDNDQVLLGLTTDMSGAATDLRNQITSYFGAGGTNIELVITENNGASDPAGKECVSVVNALYYADSLGRLMQTEFNSRLWWDYSDAGPGTSGNLSSYLYGWRMYGDLGVIMPGINEPLTNRYPVYFAAEITSHFVGGGDTVVKATSDNALVSAYAALRTNGSLALMLLNKQPITNYFVNIALSNSVPTTTATVYSYGIPQDNAAEAANNNACDITTNTCSVSANFNYALAPYSINVLVFKLQPMPPSLSVLRPAAPGQFAFQLSGQLGVTYVVQHSTNLVSWDTGTSYTLAGNTLNLTNPIVSGPSPQFWRAFVPP